MIIYRTLDSRLNFVSVAQKAESILSRKQFQLTYKDSQLLVFHGPRKSEANLPITKFSQISINRHPWKILVSATTASSTIDSTFWKRWLTIIPILLTYTSLLPYLLIEAAGIRNFPILPFLLFIPVLYIFLNFCVFPKTKHNPRQLARALGLDELLQQLSEAPTAKTVFQFNAPESKTRCAYCHDGFQSESGLECPDCKTQIHRECWEELQRCPTLGCSSNTAPQPLEENSQRLGNLSGML